MKKSSYILRKVFIALVMLSAMMLSVSQSVHLQSQVSRSGQKQASISLDNSLQLYAYDSGEQDEVSGISDKHVIGPQPWVTILCRFADSTDVTPHPKSWYEILMGSSYPGLDHYWREVSYNAINLPENLVVGWYNLPYPKSHYPTSTPEPALKDCSAAADADVFFPDFAGINVIFNVDVGFGQGGGMFLNREGQTKAYRVVWIGTEDQAQAGKAQAGLIHEMGHTFGLPHTAGIGIMGGWFSSIDPTYGQIAIHPNAFHKDLLGWIPPDRKYLVSPGTQTTITLERLALPQTDNYLMVEIPINNPDIDFYTVEARKYAGYDQTLDGNEGIAIHKVNLPPCLDLITFPSEIVPHTEDGRLQWLPGETFVDEINNVTITVNSETATGFEVTISYLPDLTSKNYLPLIIAGSDAAPNSQTSHVCVISIQTSDEYGNLKSIFVPGDLVIYDGFIANWTSLAQTATASWLVTGPCNFKQSETMIRYVSLGVSNTPYNSSIPTNACEGTYEFTFSVTYEGVTVSKSTTFTVASEN